MGWSYYTPEGALVSCSIEWSKRFFNVISYNVIIFITTWGLPLSIMVPTSFKLLSSVKKMSNYLNYLQAFKFFKFLKVTNSSNSSKSIGTSFKRISRKRFKERQLCYVMIMMNCKYFFNINLLNLLFIYNNLRSDCKIIRKC